MELCLPDEPIEVPLTGGCGKAPWDVWKAPEAVK